MEDANRCGRPTAGAVFDSAPDGTLMRVPIEAGTGEPTFATPGAVIAARGADDTEAAFLHSKWLFV